MAFSRVVSLIPSSTEIVCALGFEDQLVGRSHECDFPESVRTLPVCSEPKFNTEGTSYDLDQRVKAILQEALSVYRVRAETLKHLRPDVIITQSHCEVCAVSLREVEQAVSEWIESSAQIVSLEPRTLSDVWAGIGRVATSLGAPERGVELIAGMRKRMDDIAETARPLPGKPTVACIEWIEPLMTTGNWMPELVEMAGGVNLFGETGQHSPWITWEQLCGADPEVIIIVPCGFDIKRSRNNLPALERQSGWSDLRAVRDRHVYLADGNQYFNRPGPRLVDSLEILAEVLHPTRFNFGHQGIGWQLPVDCRLANKE